MVRRTYRRTEEHRKKMSEVLKGCIPWNKGKRGLYKHSEEVKKRISKALEGNKNSLGFHPPFRPVKWRIEQSRRTVGEKNPSWKGGISKGKVPRQEHNSLKYKAWRMAIFRRDDFTCRICGIMGVEGDLSNLLPWVMNIPRRNRKNEVCLVAHHIKNWIQFPELRYDVNNGVTLCRKCHRLWHKMERQGKLKELKKAVGVLTKVFVLIK